MTKFREIDEDRIDIVKKQIRKKTAIWFSFILFGWSYGSLGNIGVQIIWYIIPLVTGLTINQYLITEVFSVYTAIALVCLPIWVIWSILRIFTLNKAVDKYNKSVAEFFGLNNEEKDMLGIRD